MPIYEYHCTHCNKHTELLQKITDNPAKTCPHCNHNSLIKQISAAGFQLKGSGWYATDFKDKKPIQKEKDKAQTTEKTAEKSTEQSDKKPVEKPAEKPKKTVDKSE